MALEGRVNFQQLKIIREAARRDYNLTEVANMLYTSQSGVSRHIRELEEELGIEIFIRRGKRLLGMTEPGKALLVIAERILNEASNVRRLADLFTNDTSGVLTIATTHTQARYSLPTVIKSFRALFPEVRLELIQGTPQEIETLLHNGGADIGIASERLSNDSTLAAFPWFRWHHSLLVPKDHPLLQTSPLTLEEISRWPLITYRQGITGRSRIDEAFGRKGCCRILCSARRIRMSSKPTLNWGWGWAGGRAVERGERRGQAGAAGYASSVRCQYRLAWA
jgi:LysR family cys regulon transcriptional activator